MVCHNLPRINAMDNTIKFFERECHSHVPQTVTIVVSSADAVDDTSENWFQIYWKKSIDILTYCGYPVVKCGWEYKKGL
jgi:hypothetical protein